MGMGGTIIFLQLPLLSAKQMHIYWFSKVLAVKTNSKALRPGEMHDRIPPQSFHTATKMTACPSVPLLDTPTYSWAECYLCVGSKKYKPFTTGISATITPGPIL